MEPNPITSVVRDALDLVLGPRHPAVPVIAGEPVTAEVPEADDLEQVPTIDTQPGVFAAPVDDYPDTTRPSDRYVTRTYRFPTNVELLKPFAIFDDVHRRKGVTIKLNKAATGSVWWTDSPQQVSLSGMNAFELEAGVGLTVTTRAAGYVFFTEAPAAEVRVSVAEEDWFDSSARGTR